jgi:hypothetical protein
LKKNDFTREYTSHLLDDPTDILKHLQIGISIPILPDFLKYILGDIQSYNAKSIVLFKKMDKDRFKDKTDNVIGNVLVYDDGGDNLFFGYFGIFDHDPKKIEILLNFLLNYAKNNNYKYIRGPINIPTVLFGWGFMAEGSIKDLFIGCPVNPPIYQDLFLKRGFYIKFEEDRYKMLVYRYNPYKDKKYDFSEYEYGNPGKEGMFRLKDDYINLHIDYMPPSARITPKSETNFDNLVNFIFEYGKKYMMWTVHHKPTRKLVACGYVIPNIFSKDSKGRLNSVSFHDWVVHSDHRRKGLAMLMYGATSLQGFKDKIRWGSWPVGAENIANAKAAEKMGGKKDRTHLILEYKI